MNDPNDIQRQLNEQFAQLAEYNEHKDDPGAWQQEEKRLQAQRDAEQREAQRRQKEANHVSLAEGARGVGAGLKSSAKWIVIAVVVLVAGGGGFVFWQSSRTNDDSREAAGVTPPRPISPPDIKPPNNLPNVAMKNPAVKVQPASADRALPNGPVKVTAAPAKQTGKSPASQMPSNALPPPPGVTRKSAPKGPLDIIARPIPQSTPAGAPTPAKPPGLKPIEPSGHNPNHSPQLVAKLQLLWQQGKSAKHRGDITAAREAWNAALKLCPHHPGFQESLNQL